MHITTAMQRSVSRSAGEIFWERVLGRRDIIGEASSVKNTFSSWDNCMAKSYCKWPVIIVIVVVSLMVFSVLWCIIRCACCGLSCCCTCFSFLKCFDCCGGCCDGKKDRGHRYLDDPIMPPPRQGYQAPAPMPMMGGAVNNGPPQYAQFEVGRNGFAADSKATGLSEDALPPMPSWESAAKKQIPVEDEKDGMELSELDSATGHTKPLMAASMLGVGASAPPSPMNETHGLHPGQAMHNGYMGIPHDARSPSPGNFDRNGPGDPRSQSPGTFNRNGPGDPRSQSPGTFNRNGSGYRGTPSPGPGMVRGPPGRGPGPGPTYQQGVNGPGNNFGPPSPRSPYQRQESSFGNASSVTYRPNEYQNDGMNGRDFERGSFQRQYPNDGRFEPPYPPQPFRQYSNDRTLEPSYPPQPFHQSPSDSSRSMNSGWQYADHNFERGNQLRYS